MCIRDRLLADPSALSQVVAFDVPRLGDIAGLDVVHLQCHICLLYTSDAADERSSVDLGGRRIIKKKKS